jgi:hypothetical protein
MLDIPRQPGHDEALLEQLNSLYNALMTFRNTYKQWIDAMKHVGNNFTRPTMRRILESPKVMRQILEFEGQVEVASKSVIEMEVATKRVFTNLNPHDRRRQQQLSKRVSSMLHRVHASVS